MLKAKDVSAFMDEHIGTAGATGTPLTSAEGLKGGEIVAYKEGHALQGLVGRIHRVNANGTVDIFVQNSTRVEVPVTDLVLVKTNSVGAASSN